MSFAMRSKKLSLILLVLTVVAAMLDGDKSSSANANPISSDCMRNPFATGCRGISAKRSIAAWSSLSSQLNPNAAENSNNNNDKQHSSTGSIDDDSNDLSVTKTKLSPFLAGLDKRQLLARQQWLPNNQQQQQITGLKWSASSAQLEAIELLLAAASRLIDCLPIDASAASAVTANNPDRLVNLKTIDRIFRRWPVGRGDE